VVHGEKQTHLTQNQAALDVLCCSRKRTVSFLESHIAGVGKSTRFAPDQFGLDRN